MPAAAPSSAIAAAPPRCVLIIRPDSYGDLVLAVPALTALRQAWPAETRLCLLVRAGYEDLASLFPPGIEWRTAAVHPYNSPPTGQRPAIEQLQRDLADLTPDLIVAGSYTHTWLEPLVASFFVQAREVSFQSPPLSEAWTADLIAGYGVDPAAHFTETIDVRADVLEWEKNLLLADHLLGYPVARRRPRVDVPAEMNRRASGLLRKLGLANRPWAACGPAGTANLTIKAWPEESFAEVVAWLHRTHDLPTLLIGHRSEADRLGRVAEMAKSRGAPECPIWLGETGEMPLLAGLLKRASIYYGNDTGTLHLAGALERPLAAIYGGGHWPRFLPVARRQLVVYHPMPCFGCGWNCYFGDAPCVKNIPVPLVQAAIGRLLADPKAEGDELVGAGTLADNARALTLRMVGDLARKENVVQSQQAGLEQMGADLYHAKLRGDTLEQQFSWSTGHIRQLQEEAAAAQARYEQATADLKVWFNQEFVTAQANYERTTTDLKLWFAQQRDDLTAQIQSGARHAAELYAQLRRLRHQLRVRDGRISRAQGRLADRQQRLDRLQVAYWETADGLTAAAKRIAELDERARLLDSQLVTLKSRTLGQTAADAFWRNVGGWLRKRIVRHFNGDLRQRPLPPLPKISIVTPVFNAADTLAETIESVLRQEYPGLEYILVDGGSTDGSAEIIERYRPQLARVISEPDRGMYDAIAKGFAVAEGEVFGYLNADDFYEPGGLRRVGEFFQRHPRTDVVYHEDTVDVVGWRFPNVAQPRMVDFEQMLAGHNLFQDGIFFRRAAYERAGGLRRNLRLAGDWELWTRLLAFGSRFRRSGAHVSCFRVRAGQLSADMDAYRAEQQQALEDLRRLRPGWRRAVDLPAHWLRQLSVWTENLARNRRLIFPIDFTEMPPPPGIPMKEQPGAPRCPITGQMPDRLLFSSRDTRFGDARIHRFYHCAESHLAVIDPPMSAGDLGALYAEHYSNPAPQVLPPDPGSGSPYRNFRGGGWLDRWSLRARLDEPAAGRLGVTWGDKTGVELLSILRGLKAPDDAAVSLLDVGCFEGHLLDELKTRTGWNPTPTPPKAPGSAAATKSGTLPPNSPQR
jgi:glycosyltransferase involved in cell wall biosynthesis/ADP-heptose:LPS heptosyltransferase